MKMNMSVINEVRVDRCNAVGAILAVKYSTGQMTALTSPATADNDNYHRISADANGSGGSKLIVFLNIGKTSTDYTQYLFSAYATGVSDPAGVDASPTHYQCSTLQDLVDKLNDITGVSAYVLHAPTNLSLDAATFNDVSSTDLQNNRYSEVLTEALASVYRAYRRIGNPTVRDSGRLRLLGIAGTSTGNTTGTVKVYRDDEAAAATGPVELMSFTQQTAQTAYVSDNMDNCATYRGPLLLEVASSDLSAVDIAVRTVQAKW